MISLVIPFYNEEKRIQYFKDGLFNYKNANKLISEMIFVDDGSTDNTLNELIHLQKQFSQYTIHIIQVKNNIGKGNAIKAGVLKSSQPWVLCNDADLSYSMNQIDEWYENNWLDFNKKNTVYFGSRELGIKINWVEYYLHRRIIGRIYAWIIRLFTGITIMDTQCGFKLYQTTIAKEVFGKILETRFAFDVEVIYLLKKLKAEINLLPVRCEEREASKVNLIKDSWNMFAAIFRIRKRWKDF